MAIDMSGLVNVVGSAEGNAAASVNGLNGSSTASDLMKAQFEMNQYQLIATAAAAILKADADAKSAPARAISR
jgi:hypothetical protein